MSPALGMEKAGLTAMSPALGMRMVSLSSLVSMTCYKVMVALPTCMAKSDAAA